MKLTGAIFDMDGTLIDSLGFWDILWDAFSRQYGYFRPDEEADRTIRTIPMKEAMYYIHRRFGFGADGNELYETATRMIGDFYRHTVQLKPGVMEFLNWCKDRGVKMCVASATDPLLVQVAMEHCGIDGFFSHVLSCAALGKGKEEPDVFLLAREQLGTPLKETWVFEDSFVALQTAHQAGFPTVGVYDRFGFRQDILRDTAEIYIAAGETLTKIIRMEDASENGSVALQYQ